MEEALSNHKPGEIDWVTVVGSGEPTLHIGLGWMIRRVKELTKLPVAVISNGSLLYLVEVRQELFAADAVMPSLDAGSAELYRQINRPHPETTFERLVKGLIAFQREYTGELWIEVMLVQGLNDSEEALRGIADVLRMIRPDEVHINRPTRPPAETWVRPPDDAGLKRALAILGDVAKVVHPVEGTFDVAGGETVMEAILGIITRHPMAQTEIERTLALWSSEKISAVLADLEACGQARIVERFGLRFWCAGHAHYPDEIGSLASAPGRQRHDQASYKKKH